MNLPTVDLLLTGPEASWITRALEEAGINVRLAGDSTENESLAVIIDSENKDLEATVRDHSGLSIVVGWEPLAASVDAALGPHTFFERPVPIARLVQTLRAAFGLVSSTSDAPIEREQTVHLIEDAERPRPATVQLALGDELSAVFRVDAESSRSSTGALDAPEAETGVGNSEEGNVLELSPLLNDLLRSADQRLFPGEEPLDLRFAVGEEDVHRLVPDELLAEVAMPLDLQGISDPLDAFTFVGTPDLLDTATGRRGSQPDGTPHTTSGLARSGVDASSSPGEVTEGRGSPKTDLTREGLLPPGGAARMFWQLRTSRGTELRFDIPGGPSVTFLLRKGRVCEMRGAVYERLAHALREEGVVRELSRSEEEAKQSIDRAVEDGRLSSFTRDLRLRLERERLIGELCRAPECRYALTEASSVREQRILRRPLCAIATDQLRSRLGASDALRWLGLNEQSLAWLAPTFADAADELDLEPELVQAFDRAAGRPLGELLRGPAAAAGAAGALFALGSAEALRFEQGAESVSTSQALRARVEKAHALALDGDYFRILDLARNATTREVQEAHQLQLRALAHLDLVSIGLSELEGPRQEALEAIEDAYEVLRDERLRKVYAAGLTG